MKFAIYSCEGFAREVLPVLREKCENGQQMNAKIDVVFVDDDPQWQGKLVNGVKVISFNELCAEENRDHIERQLHGT